MAPSVRGTTVAADNDERVKKGMWDRRRRRLEKKRNSDKQLGEAKRSGKIDYEDEDYDPYDSDPGESYRQHCMRLSGVSTKSCLSVPKFMIKSNDTVLTAPPSPMHSEMGDLFGSVPASLPPNISRVRYSLRSSITDGSEKQPAGPSVMERRELRPNNVSLNVSHWSETGGRPYMEDRYVYSRCSFLYFFVTTHI
jgi:hypothetical protein